MKNKRPIAFILASTNHGSMLVNRFDYRIKENDAQDGIGVGYQLLNTSTFDQAEVNTAVQLLISRRQNFGDGVIAIDCGANVGVHTIEWAQAMHGWGEVIAFEAQERIYYALAGNIALNNCFNARAIFAAVGATVGEILIPLPNYFSASSFGSLEIRKKSTTEFIGQEIDYTEKSCIRTAMVPIDQLALNRLDLIKIDIEGMEMEALIGSEKSINEFKPILIIEIIKADEGEIRKFLEKFDYQIFPFGINLLAIHKNDPVSREIRVV